MSDQQHNEFAALVAETNRLPQDWALVAVGSNKGPVYDQWESIALKACDFETALEVGFLERAQRLNKYSNRWEPLGIGSIRAIGVLCGVPSKGLLFLDHDGASCDRLIEELSGQPLKEALPKTAAVTSGRKGRYQLIYQIPEMYWHGVATRKVRTGKLDEDQKAEQLEFRWTGCQSVVSGYHPQTGGYRWVYHPDNVEIAIAPQWMIAQMLKNASEESRKERQEWSDREWALSYLDAIPAAEDYDTWVQVGMALHSVDATLLGEWDKWSAAAGNYEPTACEQKWKSFRRTGTGIGTLGWLAKQAGWRLPDDYQPPAREYAAPEPEEPRKKARPTAEALQEAVTRWDECKNPFEKALIENEIAGRFDIRGSRLAGLASHLPGRGVRSVPLADVLIDVTADIETAMQSPGIPGISSSHPDLDAVTQGFQSTDLVIVAGRPSMGKTAFSLDILTNAAKQGYRSLFVSLEMSNQAIGYRAISGEASVDSSRMKSGRISEDEFCKILSSVASLAELPVDLMDEKAKTEQDIIAEAIRVKEEHGRLDLIVIDYLQLLGDNTDNMNNSLARITQALKTFQREHKVAIILLSQLSRGVEGRADKRPMMSDLRQSGSIEQDADLVMMLYRDEYYNPDTPDRGIAEVIICKNRNGPTGTVKLLFEPRFTKFRSLISSIKGEERSQREVAIAHPSVEDAFIDDLDDEEYDPEIHEIEIPQNIQSEIGGFSLISERIDLTTFEDLSIGDTVLVTLEKSPDYEHEEIRENDECPHEGKTGVLTQLYKEPPLGTEYGTVSIDEEVFEIPALWLKAVDD